MTPKCPDSKCFTPDPSPTSKPVIRFGAYYRSSDGQWITRYFCHGCRKTFSSARRSPCFRQKRRNLNHSVSILLSSGVSQRRAAIILKTTRRTVVRKFRFQAAQARLNHTLWLDSLPKHSITRVQFDDLETSEHTKCKPLSVTLAVEEKSRKILAFQVSSIPARGPLAELSRKRYGHRPDLRPQGWNRMFESLKDVVHPNASWCSDQNPHYPRHLKRHHPEANHTTVKGQRGRLGAQGELKKIGHDPLFSLNHTCAMFRANLNRLFRRTWCTTKNQAGLIDHLSLYVRFHNQVLTPSPTG